MNPRFVANAPFPVEDGTQASALAPRYLEALLAGERAPAFQMVLDAVDAGMPVTEVFLRIFQPTQREIGRLWELNRVGVAEEHYCSAATQLLMAQLYPRMIRQESGNSRPRRLVAACVGGDLHEMGLRMVADFLEVDGWDTYYLGANTPLSAIVAAVRAHRSDVVALSATMPAHLEAVGEAVLALRRAPDLQRVRVLVGGVAFARDRGAADDVGADATALDAASAVDVANRLAEEPAP